MSARISSNPSENFILIVEDNIDLREIYSECLTYEGFKIVEASNGKEALEVLHTLDQKPAVILLDLMMPVMDGWQFLQEISNLSDLLHIPIVICSAATENLPKSLPFRSKPLSKKELIDLAKKYCQAG